MILVTLKPLSPYRDDLRTSICPYLTIFQVPGKCGVEAGEYQDAGLRAAENTKEEDGKG